MKKIIKVKWDHDGWDGLEGWSYEGGGSLFDSYISALAAQSGYWDEYIDYQLNKRIDNMENV